MSQPTTRKTRDPGAIVYDAIAHYPFDNLGVVSASTPTSNPLAFMPLAVSSKIMAVGLSYQAYAGGGAAFNVVVGGGVYQGGTTLGIAARGTFTITGVPLTGQNNTYTINGVTITAPQTTGNSVTQQALADIAVLNAAMVAGRFAPTTTPAGYSFSNIAGVITYTGNAYGPAYNLTPTASSGSGGDAIAVAASTAGQLSVPLPTVAQPDQFWLTGTHNFAAVGNALFAADQAIQPGYPNTALYFPLPSDQFDVIYQQGQVLTLRLYTLVSANLVNVKAALLLKSFDVIAWHPSNTTNFQPALHIR